MDGKTHDMTSVFWPFIHFVCNMPYTLLQKTRVFNALRKVAYSHSAFKLHMSATAELDADAFYDALPLGVITDGEWLVFTDFNRMFWGMHEMYERAPDCERRKKIMRAMKIIHDIAQVNEVMTCMSSCTLTPIVDVEQPTQTTESALEELMAEMSLM